MTRNKKEKEKKDLDEEKLEDKNENEEMESKEDRKTTDDDELVELDEALKKQEELTNSLKRLQADFINYKKRVEKEKEGLVGFGIETIAVQILPVLDNFERALEIEEDKNDSFYKGIEMIYQELSKVLEKNGVEEMDCMEEKFNPEFHHAVGMEENDQCEKDTIIRILQKGYIMKDKVVRPAMVIVAK